MPIDVEAAEQFGLPTPACWIVTASPRLRHLAPVRAVLTRCVLTATPTEASGMRWSPMSSARRASLPTLHGLEILLSVGATDDPMLAAAAGWIGSIAALDGGVPFVMPTAAAYPPA